MRKTCEKVQPKQAVFIADLDDLVTRTERLIAGCSLQEMKAIMVDLFECAC